MTAQLAQVKTFTETELASALIAANGDLKLVKETTGYNERQILEAFLREAATNIDTQNSIKSYVLLNFLQILTEVKDQLIGSIDGFSAHELISTIKMIVEGIGNLLPQQPQGAQPTNINLFQQFGGDQARDRIEARLETMRKLEGQYTAQTD